MATILNLFQDAFSSKVVLAILIIAVLHAATVLTIHSINGWRARKQVKKVGVMLRESEERVRTIIEKMTDNRVQMLQSMEVMQGLFNSNPLEHPPAAQQQQPEAQSNKDTKA